MAIFGGSRRVAGARARAPNEAGGHRPRIVAAPRRGCVVLGCLGQDQAPLAKPQPHTPLASLRHASSPKPSSDLLQPTALLCGATQRVVLKRNKRAHEGGGSKDCCTKRGAAHSLHRKSRPKLRIDRPPPPPRRRRKASKAPPRRRMPAARATSATAPRRRRRRCPPPPLPQHRRRRRRRRRRPTRAPCGRPRRRPASRGLQGSTPRR